MSIVFDYAAINRRMNCKPEPEEEATLTITTKPTTPYGVSGVAVGPGSVTIEPAMQSENFEDALIVGRNDDGTVGGINRDSAGYWTNHFRSVAADMIGADYNPRIIRLNHRPRAEIKKPPGEAKPGRLG